MFIKKYDATHTIRAWQCVNTIDKLKKSLLGHPYISTFVHDITYGKGRFSILSNDRELLKLYYANTLPAFFTNETGRILPDGVYISHMLPMSEDETNRLENLKQILKFAYILHVVKHEGDIQHTFSFTLNCDDHQLVYFLANKLPQIHRFIAIYERQCVDSIDFVKAEKNHLILPYSTEKEDALSTLVQSYLVDEPSCIDNELQVPHSLDHQWVSLSHQQARCFQLLLQGLTAKEIAQEMNLSYRTIQNYTACIYERLGVETGRELMRHYSYLLK